MPDMVPPAALVKKLEASPGNRNVLISELSGTSPEPYPRKVKHGSQESGLGEESHSNEKGSLRERFKGNRRADLSTSNTHKLPPTNTTSRIGEGLIRSNDNIIDRYLISRPKSSDHLDLLKKRHRRTASIRVINPDQASTDS